MLRKQKESIEQIGKAEEKVLEFCQRVRLNLHSLGYDERQLLLEALSVKVIAYRDRVELRYALPTYVTIEQTSAYMLNNGVVSIPFLRSFFNQFGPPGSI